MKWIYHTGGKDITQVEQAFVRGEHEIVIEAKWESYYYTVPLVSKDGVNFTADFECKKPAKTSRVQVSCKLWLNKSGYLLFGEWIEEGNEMLWIVELHVTELRAE